MKLRSKIAIAVGVAALITTVALGMVFMPLVTLITLAALTGIAFLVWCLQPPYQAQAIQLVLKHPLQRFLPLILLLQERIREQ